MSSPSMKLYRLRGIFVAYFVLKSLIGIVVAWSVLQPMAGRRFGGWGGTPGSLAFFSLMAAALILAVALVVFSQLIQRKNWARVLLLIIGWLTVIGAVINLLASTQITQLGPWIARWLPDMDWEKLMRFDRVQKVFELLFWGYLISVLQLDSAVRDEFFPQAPVEKTPEK